MTVSSAVLSPERDADPLDAVLDLVERSVTAALALGLGPQLEARLARLLPTRVTTAASRSLENGPPEAAAPAGASGQSRAGLAAAGQKIGPAVDPERALAIAGIVTTLRRIESFRLTAAEHAAIAVAKRWLLTALDDKAGAASIAAANANGETA